MVDERNVKYPHIDIHAHFYPRAYLDLLAQEGAPFGARYREDNGRPVVDVGPLHAGPLELSFIDLELRLEAMDIQGVDMQALSLTQPMVYWADDNLARRLSAAFNDALANAHEKYPDSFVGLAMLPVQAPQEALAELDRINDVPGICGVYMGTTIQDMALSDERLFPIFERLEDMGMPIFLHPLKVIGMEDRLSRHFFSNLLGNPFDTTVAAGQLMFGGVLDRFPNLEIVLPHAGGALPYVVGRMQHGWKVRSECGDPEKPPIEYLRRFHYDTIAHSEPSLSFLIETVGVDRILMGSDYCFDMGYTRPVEVVTQHPDLDEHTRQAILGANAKRLLGF